MKNILKRISLIVVCLLLVLSCTACGDSNNLVSPKVYNPDHANKPSDSFVAAENDKYQLKWDKENKRISLGHKVDAENPWTILSEKYAEGDVVEAKVAGLTPFGAFAEIIPGIDGLIHISQISNKKIAKPDDELTVGETVKAMITAIDFEAKKVRLSMRALLEPVAEAEEAAEEAVEAADAE